MVLILFLISFTVCEASLGGLLGLEKEEACEINEECYRTFDGTYNNLNYPYWGAANTSYARLFDSSCDGEKNGFPKAKNGEKLPNPRKISLQVSPDIPIDDPIWTAITVAWGQFNAHDMSLATGTVQTGKQSMACCTTDGFFNDNVINDRCKPIKIPKVDPYYYPEGRECFNFVRTVTSCDLDDSKSDEFYEQLSSVTGYIDMSPVYGNNKAVADSLRTFENGQLQTTEINGRMYPPMAENPEQTCTFNDIPENYCFRSGDIRINQNPPLTLMHTILLRQHNAIADELCNKVNPQWSDEQCYQEARKINIALEQHVTYYEYLPFILGEEILLKKKIFYPEEKGCVPDYDDKVDASAINEFSAAAFKFYHSSIIGFLEFYSQCRNVTGGFFLSDWYNNPTIITIENNELELATGQTTQLQYKADRFYTDQVTNFLFKVADDFGTDLRARDIQRGRDHCLDSYPNALEKCGLGKIKDWEDFEKFIIPSYVKLLKKVYDDPEDVELTVGAILEELIEGAISGPTYNCIIAEQFYRSRVGDRYFFESCANPCPFTDEQLANIREAGTISAIVCNNVDGFDQIQAQGFKKISDSNPLVACDELPYLDLYLWQESKSLF